jgi:predicted dienelactone hydrolase
MGRLMPEPERILLERPGREALPIDVAWPGDRPPFPLVVFSHGSGAIGGYRELLARWASAGIVVAAPVHEDALERLLPRYGISELSRDALERNPEIFDQLGLGDVRVGLARARDVIDTIEALTAMPDGTIDRRRVGVAGHSYGAHTAQLVAGATITGSDGVVHRVASDRVSALTLLSGPGAGSFGLTDTSWENLSVPLLVVTGSNDRGPSDEPVEWRCQAFRRSGGDERWLLVVDGADHRLGGIAVPELGGDAAHRELVAAGTTDFWQRHLLSDAAAEERLTHYTVRA